MLYFDLPDPHPYNSIVDEHKAWHLVPADRSLLLQASTIKGIMVCADGDELAFIRAYFKNLPIMNCSRTNVWVGETALFIILNLMNINDSEFQAFIEAKGK